MSKQYKQVRFRTIDHPNVDGLLSIYYPIAIAAAWLCFGWGVFVVIDVFNLWNTQQLLFGAARSGANAYFQLFRDGGPTEWLQWAFLGGAALTWAYLAGVLFERENPISRLFLLMAGAMLLMLIEDAGNPRHMLGRYAAFLGGDVGRYVASTLVMAAIAALPLFALVRYWKLLRYNTPERTRARRLLIAAFAVYGLAAASSALSVFWYDQTGHFILERILGGRVVPMTGWWGRANPDGYLLMDNLFEESVELIGASFFLAAANAFRKSLR